MADLTCSFCGQGQAEVSRLIAGPAVQICDRCVVLSAQIIQEQAPLGGLWTEGQILVRVGSGDIHGCQRQTDWEPFAHDGHDFEWCWAHGAVRGKTPLLVVCVRRAGAEGVFAGAAFEPDRTLAAEQAKTIAASLDADAAL